MIYRIPKPPTTRISATPVARPKPTSEIEIFWRSPLRWPIEPAGYVFLAKAFQQIGHAMFGAEWSGTECFTDASALPDIVRQFVTDRNRLPASLHNSAAGSPELRAYQRGVSVQREIARRAQAGQLVTAWRHKAGGSLVPIAPDLWNTEQLSPRFYWCQMSPSDPFGRGVGGDSYGWIFVQADTLQQVLQSFGPSVGDQVPPAPARRGPKERYDWEEAELYTRKLLSDRGDFAVGINQTDDWRALADVERLVMPHVTKHSGGQEPAESTLRNHVTTFVERWRADNKADNSGR